MWMSPRLNSRTIDAEDGFEVFNGGPLRSIALFALGSALAGASQSMNMLVAARGEPLDSQRTSEGSQ